MISTTQLIESGIGITLICFVGGWRVALIGFSTIGMLMFFTAWLQFINYNGNTPRDQPFVTYNHPSPEETKRLWDLVSPIHSMTDQDWADYHRCKDHAICVRRFQRGKYNLNSTDD